MTTDAMNPATVTMDSADERVLQDRLADLEQRIEARAQARRKRQMLTLVVGGCLALFSSVMLTRLSMQSRELTTEALVQMARTNVEPEIPGARATMEAHLIQQAPDIVQNSMQSVVDTLPSLRVQLTKGFSNRLDQVNEKFESRVRTAMAVAISESKLALDQRYPNRSDREKLDLLGEEIAKQLKRTTDDILDSMYPEYTAEMRRLTADIERLYAADPRTLTQKDRIKRELIQTMAVLAQREGNVLGEDIRAAAAPYDD
ncbi:MAG: hypothetical protein V3T86_11880 [Planctomycetota bacterium]